MCEKKLMHAEAQRKYEKLQGLSLIKNLFAPLREKKLRHAEAQRKYEKLQGLSFIKNLFAPLREKKIKARRGAKGGMRNCRDFHL